ncbi:MAG: fibronectin type III domain-containing protein, partial [Actinomycetota bacterium]|nr:fibronectin type III domain-containing protein [Actinomycetota bacterium]
MLVGPALRRAAVSVLVAATVVYGIPVGPIISAEAAGNYSSVALSDSPNAYWRLGEAPGATAATDATGHGNSLTVQGAPALGAPGAVTGDSNTAAQFSSATAVLTRTSAPVTTTANWTLEAWLYPAALPQSSVAIYNGVDASGQGGYGFGIGSNTGGSGSNLIANLGSAGFIASGYTFAAANRWYHVAMTRDATTLRFYVNGQPTASTSTVAPAAVGARFSIGAGVNSSGAAVSPFSGTIDEAAVYAAPVSAGRVAAHYQEAAAAISGFGNWIAKSPATIPAGRFDASIVYDGARNKVLMFGGKNSVGTALNETWTYDGTNWAQLNPATSPPARWGAAIAYNAANSTVVMFGGLAGTTYMVDTWIWNGTTWTKGPTAGPAKRFDASAGYNAANSTTVLFGGYNGSAYLQDTWTWNGTVWTSLNPATKPGLRAGASAAYHAPTSKVVLFGGYNGTTYLPETWTWNGTTWAQVTTNASPPGRRNGAMAYDATTSTLVLNGGLTASGALGDTWTWDGSLWSSQAPGSSPSIRSGAGAAYSSTTNSVVMFGGVNGTTFPSDTLTWNTPPAAPTPVTATPGNSQVVVAWTPGSNGGQAVTGYTVTPFVGTTAGTPITTGAVSTTTISGLTNGTLYTFQVTAANAVGTGAAAISPQVKPTGPPGPPTNVVASAGVNQATVTWGAPVNNGGSTVTGYTITPYANGVAGTPVSVGTAPTTKTF